MNVDTVPIDDNQKADSFSGPGLLDMLLSIRRDRKRQEFLLDEQSRIPPSAATEGFLCCGIAATKYYIGVPNTTVALLWTLRSPSALRICRTTVAT